MTVLDFDQSGRNSAVECQLPKLDVAGSTPVARSTISPNRISYLRRSAGRAAGARSARGSHFQAKFRLFRREFGGKLVSPSANALGSSRPSRVVADDHFEVRVTHLMRHVLRIFPARKLYRGVGAPTRIDSATPQRSLH